jgi:hypothetical protein
MAVHRPGTIVTVGPDDDYVCDVLGVTVEAADRIPKKK